MESSISSHMFKGSISEAIITAKTQKKLFVIYISGEDGQSSQMESSTWMDTNVTRVLSKYCVVLQLFEGTTDAAHFSAIYPQTSVPSITAVGYNGIQLWRHEGFVSAEILASTLEKAWLSLHLQETTATVISAALASTNYETGMAEMHEVSTSMDIVAPLVETTDQVPNDKLPATSEDAEEVKVCPHKDEEMDAKLDEELSSAFSNSDEIKTYMDEDEQSASSSKFQCASVSREKVNAENSVVDHISLNSEDGCSPPQKEKVHNESDETAPIKNTKAVEGKDNAFDIATRRSNEVHLNIRLPNGSTLQEKFSTASALTVVKDFINQSQDSSGMSSYDLAIPYPRKVFSNQDLNSSLSELGLLNRQALIVVPHQKGESSSKSPTNAAQVVVSKRESNGGYFAYARSMLSYLNPFSYLGAHTSSSPSLYGSNSATQTSQQRAREPFTTSSPNQSISSNNKKDGKKVIGPSTSRIGGNVHTLEDDKDDGRFGDRNAFWNGNSTVYGGGGDNDGCGLCLFC